MKNDSRITWHESRVRVDLETVRHYLWDADGNFVAKFEHVITQDFAIADNTYKDFKLEVYGRESDVISVLGRFMGISIDGTVLVCHYRLVEVS